MQHQYYFSYFCLYQRYILYPMSLYTWANLNFTLCGHPKDPFRLYIDKYYIIFSEIYLSFGSYLFRHMMKQIVNILLYIENYIVKNKKE